MVSENSCAILKTTDGGYNWIIQNSNFPGILNSVYFINQDTGFAVGGEQIYNTYNGGNSWQHLELDKTITLNSISFNNNKTGFIVGYQEHQRDSSSNTGYNTALIYKSTDYGNNWFIQNQSYKGQLIKISVGSENTMYVLADDIENYILKNYILSQQIKEIIGLR